MTDIVRRELDALDLLMQDHREMESLFREFEYLRENRKNTVSVIANACTELRILDTLQTEIFYASVGEAVKERLVVFFFLLVVVRGLPSMLIYRGVLAPRERLQMTLLTATALPLLVALAAIGLANGHMLPENAAALVGAGVLSVMFFPAAAVQLGKTRQHEAASS